MRTIARAPGPGAVERATIVSAGSGTTSAAVETVVQRQRIDSTRWIDEVRSAAIARRPSAIVISPGPKTPAEAGISIVEAIASGHSANLSAISVNCQGPALQRGVEKMCHPTLVLCAELARTRYARHPENDCRQVKYSSVIAHVLIGRSFGTTIGRVEI